MSITLGGKRAAELYLSVLIDSEEPALPETRDRTLEIPGRHGLYDFGADLGPRMFELQCAIIQPNAYALQRAVRALAAHLMDGNGRPRTLELIFDEEPDKVYFVRYAGSVSIQKRIGLGKFSLPLVAYDPFAYSTFDASDLDVDSSALVDSEISVDADYDFAVNAPTTLGIENFGSMNATPIIEISGSFSSLSLTLGGLTLHYNAPLSATQLILDCEKYTARVGTTNVLGNTSGRFGHLPPGLSDVVIGGSSLDIQIGFRFRAKYL